MAGQLILHIVLVIVWVLLTNDGTSKNLLVGALISGIVLAAIYSFNGKRVYLRRVYAALKLAVILLWEQVKSNIDVMRVVLKPNMDIQPAIVKLRLENDLTDGEITAVTHMITLTPGTLSVHLTEDREYVYVHMLNGGKEEEDGLIGSKQLFERLVLGVTRG